MDHGAWDPTRYIYYLPWRDGPHGQSHEAVPGPVCYDNNLLVRPTDVFRVTDALLKEEINVTRLREELEIAESIQPYHLKAKDGRWLSLPLRSFAGLTEHVASFNFGLHKSRLFQSKYCFVLILL
jgi:hypothetical protein